LPSITGESLTQISFLVKEADCNERQVEITGGFEMIAGEEAETSRINGQTFGDAKFQGEISSNKINRLL